MRYLLLCFFLVFGSKAQAQDTTSTPLPPSPTITLLANGQKDTLVVKGEPFTLSHVAEGAVQCELLQPLHHKLGMKDERRISTRHLLYKKGYPKPGGQKVYEISCKNSDGVSVSAQIVIIRLP
jgi:hypothetical protein